MNNTLFHALVSKTFLTSAGEEGFPQNALSFINVPVHPDRIPPGPKIPPGLNSPAFGMGRNPP